MKGFKGFDKGLVCRGKQYKENTVFEEEAAEICKSGMHFCENPFDVLEHYDLVNTDGSFNEFAEVEALDKCLTDDNKKYCTKKLKIGAKLSFSGFVNACIEFILEKTKIEQTDEEDETVIGSSGDSAQIGSSGDYAKIGSSGNSAKIGSSGNSAKITSEGEDSVICCLGHNSIVRAKKGSWITLSEWEKSFEKDRRIPKCVKTKFVDGEIIKADTFYRLENGKFVEVKEDKQDGN
jgi:hypothetical protein